MSVGCRGINTYAYVAGNPVMAVDPVGLETCVVVTTNSIGFRDHSALYMSQGGTGGSAFLFDPSGSYASKNGGGTGDFVEGKAADLNKFAKYHKDSKVEKACKDTSKEEEQRLAEKIMDMPSPGIAACAVNVSNALSGSKWFSSVTPGTFFPGNLYRAAGGK